MFREALTFDDVLLVPKKGVVSSRKEVKTETRLTKKIKLNIPVVSSNMDTVTEHKMAIALAREGGIGIIHRFMPLERQIQEVEKVKRAENIVIEKPYVVSPETTLRELLRLVKTHNVQSFPVVEGKKLVGIITRRDFVFVEDLEERVSSLMTPKKELVVLSLESLKELDLEEAKRVMIKNGVEKLPLVNKDFELIGLITAKDLARLSYPSSKDKEGKLLVGCAVGVKDHLERTKKLIEVGVDVIVVDIAHGHSDHAIKAIKEIKKEFDIEIIAGNVATKEGTEDLISAGADCVKVGIGPGAACTTRIVTGFGVPQLTAILDCFEVAKQHNIPIMADGGLRTSGDFVKAIAAGASTCMFGSLFAGTEESPGPIIRKGSKKYKVYRGMASSLANLERALKEGKEVSEYFDYNEEGVEGVVEYKGSVREVIKMLVDGLRSGVSYAGFMSVEELIGNGDFIKITQASLKESKPHDFMFRW